MMKLTKSERSRVMRMFHFIPKYLRAVTIEPLHHPVSLYRAQGWKNQFGYDQEILVCPCSFDLSYEYHTDAKGKRRRHLHRNRDEFHCPHKRAAMEIWKAELRGKHGARWGTMPLADAIVDIWGMFKRGEYLGEHNVGMLYTQDLDDLLAQVPEKIPYYLGTQKHFLEVPSRNIMATMQELKKRKLIDLSGNVLIPFQEYFRFPDEMHREIAFAIGDPLGWPNGDAGDGFLWQLYENIVRVTGWKKGEDVFGKDNIPNLTPTSVERWVQVWGPALDIRLSRKDIIDKSEILREIPTEVWVGWLQFIARDIATEGKDTAP